MFDRDRWHEVLETMRRHRLRTFLTGLSVAWGIFMLVLLQGAGNGLRNATEARFADDAVNSLWVYPGRTSKPYQGLGPGRRLRFTNRDYDRLALQEEVDKLTGRFRIRDDYTVNYRAKRSSFDVRAVHPDHLFLERTLIVRGRFVNNLDIAQKRKIAVIGDAVKDVLFGKEDPLGKYISVSGTAYQVVGIFKDQGSEGERRKIYLPISTAQAIYNAREAVDQLMFTVGDATAEQTLRIEQDIRGLFARNHRFDPKDERALRIRNNIERFENIMQIFDWIAMFVWIIGAGTIAAGIVGVSNIMMISVKERTKEFGVRKAIGAPPGSIVGLVVQEAVLLTSLAGYMGLVAGVGLLELASKALPDNEYLQNPSIDFRMAITATFLLIGAGTLAGFFPARRAAKVNPIVALRNG